MNFAIGPGQTPGTNHARLGWLQSANTEKAKIDPVLNKLMQQTGLHWEIDGDKFRCFQPISPTIPLALFIEKFKNKIHHAW